MISTYNLKTLKELRLSLEILHHMIEKMIDMEEQRIIEEHCREN